MVDSNYSSDVDILTLDIDGREPEDYQESLPIGDYVIDLGDEGEFLGLEILNASQNLPFTSQELENIESAELELNQRGEATTISVNIEYSGNTGKFSLGYETNARA
jgi:uncharacterized protein YuzE